MVIHCNQNSGCVKVVTKLGVIIKGTGSRTIQIFPQDEFKVLSPRIQLSPQLQSLRTEITNGQFKMDLSKKATVPTALKNQVEHRLPD